MSDISPPIPKKKPKSYSFLPLFSKFHELLQNHFPTSSQGSIVTPPLLSPTSSSSIPTYGVFSRYEYSTLQDATANFDIDLWMPGDLYVTCTLYSTNTTVAIKKISDKSGQSDIQFQAKVESLGKVRHENIARLLGYGSSGNEKLLVYEYNYFKTTPLYTFMFGSKYKRPLKWSARYNIIKTIAQGIQYYQCDIEHPIIHLDISVFNIWVDILASDDMNPKIAELGLTTLRTPKKLMDRFGTSYHSAPECFQGNITPLADVYSFGVLILEIISNAYITNNGIQNAKLCLEDDKPRDFIDATLLTDETYVEDEIMKCIHLALSAMQDYNRRPTIKHIIRELHSTTLIYPFQTLKGGTNNFSEDHQIVYKGFGLDYKTRLPNGTEVKIKKILDESGQSDTQFQAKVESLGKVTHKNIAILLGYSSLGNEKLLLYEYVGTVPLDSFMFGSIYKGPLKWSMRYNIIKGIAQGIRCYQYATEHPIIHLNITASNIWVDFPASDDMNPKIAELGLTTMFHNDLRTPNKVMDLFGTFCHIAPECFQGNITPLADVYSFGMLILEIVSNRRITDNALEIAKLCLEKAKPQEFMDAILLTDETYVEAEVIKCIRLALSAIQNYNRRPTIKYITQELLSTTLIIYNFKTLKAATNNFHEDHKINYGGFGLVYKGYLNGQDIAVQRLSKNYFQGDIEFKTGIELLANVHHKNVVNPLGYSSSRRERLVVYKFLKIKSLDYLLFDADTLIDELSNWSVRYNIIQAIARGVLHLQEEIEPPIIHRNLNSAMVLLDADMSPKIGGLDIESMLSNELTTTKTYDTARIWDYIPPEYKSQGTISPKLDVYCFGLLVLEIISGIRISEKVNKSGEKLLSYAWICCENGNPLQLIDQDIDYTDSDDEVKKCIIIALLCLQDYTKRPTMKDIVDMLRSDSDKYILESIPQCPDELMYSCLSNAERSTELTSGTSKPTNDLPQNPDGNNTTEFMLYDYQTLMDATNNFAADHRIGRGAFGFVYKAEVTGQLIAIKRLSKDSGQGENEFMSEVKLLAKLRHRNLVELLGYCSLGRERLLIYEFLKNKSLDNFLFDADKKGQLTWPMRYNIIKGIARGILYLHRDVEPRIIHRDIKAPNVLLDDNMNPKIADFGLARIFNVPETHMQTIHASGTRGYMPKEYLIDGTLSVKLDVYSFGVVVLEIVSGRRINDSINQSVNESLYDKACRLSIEENTLELFDPTIKDTCVEEEVINCINLGLLSMEDYSHRPTMEQIVCIIESYSHSALKFVPRAPKFISGKYDN